MTLKEQYWKDGYVFRFREGDRRMVWGDKLIDKSGYISKDEMSDELIYTESTLNDRVIAIYKPNKNVCNFADFTKCKEIVWRKSEYIFSIEEIKERLGIPFNEELIITKY